MSKLLSFERFRILKEQEKKIMENSSQSHSYGCVMLYFNMPEIKELHSKIDERDVYTDPDDTSFGLEYEPHVTLLYGVHSSEVNDDDVIKILDKFKNQLTEVNLTKVSKFENPKYDVLKFDIDSDILHIINSKLCEELPYTTDYPEYHPHLTIAYIKPKIGKKYIEMFENMSFKLEPLKFVYSKPDGSKIYQVI